jgi:hypothetical protein
VLFLFLLILETCIKLIRNGVLRMHLYTLFCIELNLFHLVQFLSLDDTKGTKREKIQNKEDPDKVNIVFSSLCNTHNYAVLIQYSQMKCSLWMQQFPL